MTTMTLYEMKGYKLEHIPSVPFKRERELQELFEANLYDIMGVRVVRSEFSIKNRRIDTLAYDEQSKSFVIIEYKRDKQTSVIDQGFTYLGLMLENKADVVLEHQLQLKSNLKPTDVDWSQTRVAFVSTGFTDNQLQASNFKDIAIELWEVRRYHNNTVHITPIKKSPSATSIKPLALQNTTLKAIADEIKVYTEDDHLRHLGDDMVALYERFRDAILNLADGIEVVPQKYYIAFKKDKNLACLNVQKKTIKINIGAKSSTIDDPKGMLRDVSAIGHCGTGDVEVKVDSDQDLEYIMSLVKQVLRG